MANNQPSRKEVVLTVGVLTTVFVVIAGLGFSLISSTDGTPTIQPVQRNRR